jgi:signal transduction histidine kinase
MKRLPNWLLPPTTGDAPRDANLRILHTILIILLAATSLASAYYLLLPGETSGWIILAGLLPQAFCLWLTRRGAYMPARYLILSSMLVMATLLLFNSAGLHGIALLLYPVLILSASLFLTRRGYIWLVAACGLSITLVAADEIFGLLTPNRQTMPGQILTDLLMTLLILFVTAVVVFLLAQNMRNSLATAQANQQALLAANQALHQEIGERQRAEKIQQAIYRISEAAQSTQNLTELYVSIHQTICELMPARNFYITLYDAASDLLTTPFLADEYRSHWPPYKPGKGLAAYVLRTGKPLLITPAEFDRLEKSGQAEILVKRMIDWIGVPLRAGRGIIGVMAVQTYKPEERLTEADKDVLMFVSTQVATAIERKQAEEERQRLIARLEAQNTELERFTYTVSHDLKSPLITIRGFADYMRRDLAAGNIERVQQDLTRISQSAEKMQELLNNLLELSRIGRLMNPPEAIPFGEIVAEALARLEGPLQASGVRAHCHEATPTIYGDRARLVEVLQNLLENAIKFMGEQPNPRIEIGVVDNPADEMPVLYVRDNGIGIEAQYHQKIFGLFEKLAGGGEGTGIGLALVKRIIEVHGGQIWVESAGLGQGSTFYFTLPTAVAAG